MGAKEVVPRAESESVGDVPALHKSGIEGFLGSDGAVTVGFHDLVGSNQIGPARVDDLDIGFEQGGDEVQGEGDAHVISENGGRFSDVGEAGEELVVLSRSDVFQKVVGAEMVGVGPVNEG